MLGVLGSIPDGAAEPRGCKLTLHPRGEGGDGASSPCAGLSAQRTARGITAARAECWLGGSSTRSLGGFDRTGRRQVPGVQTATRTTAGKLLGRAGGLPRVPGAGRQGWHGMASWSILRGEGCF